MALTISNNGAVQAASYHLGKAQQGFDISLRRLASGKKILGPNDDPGTLSVAMKVKASINRLTGAQNNIKNAIGFLEVQDGLLETVGRIVMRMSELKGYATQDPLKSDSDIASYNNEFKDLQVQLYQISQMNFNGASLFALYATNNDNPGATYPNVEAVFGASEQNAQFDHTLDIYTSSEGSEGTKVSIHKSLLLSALTLHQNGDIASDANVTGNIIYETDGNTSSSLNGLWSTAKDANSKQHPTGKELNKSTGALGGANNAYLTLAVTDTEKALDLYQVSAGVFEKAIENVVFLRAQTGGGMTRLNFALDSITSQETNMRSALGRIEDVDIASESASLARYGILMQAAAAMAVQATIQNDVALMLLR
jgi:flagellin-like hook-associated protein FlgL